MITRETDRVLIGLAKIETGLSKIYEKLSGKPYFRSQVKSFWSELAREEMVHAQVFNQIRGKVLSELLFPLQLQYALEYLRDFVNKKSRIVLIPRCGGYRYRSF